MELYITSRDVSGEDGTIRKFQYYLIIEQVTSGSFQCENYGVRIVEEGILSSSLPGLTTSAVRIDQLMTMLVDNTVGPVGLEDIILDWL